MGGVDEDGNPVDPYGGPTTGEVVDGIRGAMDRATERVRGNADARSEPQARAREVDCSEMADETACNECALKQGYIDKPSTGRYVNQRNIINYDYQLYIANMRSAPLRFGYVVADKADPERNFFSVDTLFDYLNRRGYSRTIQEWHFNACEFDGFWPDDCMVVEAKGNYDHFLDENGEPRYFFVYPGVFEPWGLQMQRQKAALTIAEPEGKLLWCFMQELTMAAGISIAGIDPSICKHEPMPGASL
ncbi:Tox-REase-5 domain-containing protein [Luteimonas sp. RD2P54]|uniref:Tox-REase-5 domain-containing protein n=1 Tax=Luteimonas endophytica TaxID=3042023 RepID=A0ABT6J516_9GAMM|nr:Tox-REase-5 domain-containing protein [Luteimonas endophytica]MDH5821909.1 Tox-REase-5 domain-containing protein [Luteimonas endophytica]